MRSFLKISGLAVLLSSTAMTANAGNSGVEPRDLLAEATGYVQVAETTVKKNGTLEDEKAALAEKFEEWSNQLSAKTESAAEATDETADEASDALDKAWADVTASWESLQEATEENWDTAKTEYEEALVRLEKAWDEMTSES